MQSSTECRCSVCCYLGLAYKDKPRHDYDKSVEYFEKALKLCTDNDSKAKIYSNLGFTYMGNRKYVEALSFFNKVLEFDNIDENVKSMAICCMGIVNSDLNNYDDAIGYLNRFIELSNTLERPEIVRALYVLGKAYFAIGTYDKMQECFQKILDSESYDAEILIEMGVRYGDGAIKNYGQAIACFQRAQKIGYNADIIYFYIGLVYFCMRTEDAYVKAKQYFGMMANKDIDVKRIKIENVYTNLGLAYYIRDENDKSIEYSQKALNSGENPVNPYYNMGLAYERKGDCESHVFYENAIVNFIKVIELEDNAWAYFMLGIVFIKSSLFGSQNMAVGVRYIQYAAELGVPQAQAILDDNQNLVLEASKISISPINKFLPYVIEFD